MAITDLDLVPYGNAHVLTRDPPTFKCQHGDEECYGNWVELCAQKYNPANWWNFILCEEASEQFDDQGVKKCAEQAGINAEEVLTCAHGTEGPLLHLEAADKTPADHKWVPWVVVDGKVMGEEDEFIDMVCNAYKGEKPASCKKSVKEAEKVKATLYYEVFCPGCRSFIQNDLVEFRKHDDLMAITDLDLVPYGNAHVLTRDPPTFKCQHGDEECYGNWVELCAQKYNPANWWNFILCEEASEQFDDQGVKKCAEQAGINAEEVLTCAHGTEGPLLHLEAADKTPADHKWVPWVVVDGKVMGEEDEFIDMVCNAYKGEKPASCKKSVKEAEKVPVALYHESYCPGCKSLLTGFLNKMHQNEDVMKMAEFDIVSYGNAHVLTRDPPTFQCQHGEKECYGNFVQLCAMEHNKENYWDFLIAIDEAADYSDESVKKVAGETGLDGAVILECAKGTEGPLLHLKAADKTPNHEYVPWLVINGKHIEHEKIQTTFVKEICDAYKGDKPAICNQ